MGYGDYQRHLMDHDPPIYDAAYTGFGNPFARLAPHPTPCDSFVPIPYPPIKTYSPSAPLQPFYAVPSYPSLSPTPSAHGAPMPWVVRSDLQVDAMACAQMAPHQQRLATAMARDHGRDFKAQLHALYASDAQNVRTVCDILQRGRSIPQRLGFGSVTVGVILRVTPNRIAITPNGFFSVAQPPVGKTPGALAPLCSTDFVLLGTPHDFMQQIHAELNGLIRNRADLWRDLLLFTKPKKNLHTCRTMRH